jgi:methyl-accepting chemotaxis protein
MTTHETLVKRTMSIRSKLTLQGVGVVLGIGVLSWASFSTLRALQMTGPLYREIVRDKDLLADILPPPANILESFLVVHRMTIETDKEAVDKHAKALTDLRTAYNDRIEVWQKDLPEGAMKSTLVQSSRASAQAFYDIVDKQFLPTVREGRIEEAKQLLETALVPKYDEHRAAIDEVVRSATASAAGSEQVATRALSTRSTMLLGIAALVGLTSAAGCLVIGRSVMRRIPSLLKFAESMASGDLTARLNFRTSDEFGRLGDALDKGISAMSQVVGDVSRSSTEVAGAATEIAAAAEQMSASVSEVARQASAAAESAGKSGEMAVNGGEVVSKTVTEMKQIFDAVNTTAETIGALGKRGDEIGKVIGVINDIADQTNLLALNAAIEAARAGEHGRGFAVVADEVRKLAERTTRATEEVAKSIQAIQEETKVAVKRMNRGTEQVKTGVGLAEQAGQNLSQIVQGANEVSTLITSISAASDQAGAATVESAQAAQELSTKAEALRQMVGRFKIGREQNR